MSESQPSSRFLAPAPAPGQPPQLKASDHAVQGRKHKTTACQACKLKKLKCRGDPPCQHCVANGLHCQVDEMADMRRKYAMKRKLERLEQAEETLVRLVSALRDSESKRLAQLLNLIRSNASFDELQIFLQKKFTPPEIEQCPELRDIQTQISRPSTEDDDDDDNESHPHPQQQQQQQKQPPSPSPARSSRRFLDVRRLADSPVYRVPARPWTKVTDDDELVSHLISLWLTWTYPFFDWLDKDLFLRDMRAGQLQCQFCSPFLVNAILSEASYYSDYAEVFTVPNDTLTRGDHFYDEARHLLEREDGAANLPTIQGLLILFVRMALMGKDRLGWMYLDLAIRGAEEYDERYPPRLGADNPSPEPLRVLEDVANRTLWGAFNIAATATVSLMKHLDVSPPRRPRIAVHHHDPRDVWFPYPREVESVPGHHACVFDRWSAFCCIAIQISTGFHNVENPVSLAQMPGFVHNIHAQLQDWYASLPPCLSAETAAAPHVLSLHLFYHTTVMQIFSYLRANHSTPSPPPYPPTKTICLASARQVSHLLGLHRNNWGIDRMAPSTIQWCCISLFTLMDALDAAANRNAFIELCVFARAFSRRFPLAKGILRMIQLSATQAQVVLPEETDVLFADFESAAWKERDVQVFSSFYPHPHFVSVVRRGRGRGGWGGWVGMTTMGKDYDYEYDYYEAFGLETNVL
ncbi:hypothetical protein BO70DRAFT_386976 [Aspergillus heteromorphus CBS 117.55]|uniref:Zn(2)-C6 fungal-type domain-containing protein n=1 Tax=Aspergillus heteromorphus CBS 117.55 TaxID=1448321 RepID=A0A317WHD3_9EURO|nr:uncharacterized protein BO70DRAFT_386976 [Aspergillus heteromorphus CBS 117.55]PWY83610.1 hypothetical protein BO70DRAFT_386976 [Aspergillus heteromorphus CBS 117.55]